MLIKKIVFTLQRSEIFLPLVRTFVARGAAALGSLLLILVLGRIYGPAGVGVYALAQSIIIGAAILSRYGMDNALIRYVGQDPCSEYTLKYLVWACKRSLIASFLAAIVIFLMRNTMEKIFAADGLSSVLVGVSFGVPAFTLSFIFSGYFKGVRKPATACLLENGSISLVACVLLLGWHFISGHSDLSLIGWTLAFAAWLTLAQGGWQLQRWRKQCSGWSAGSIVVSREQFRQSSKSYFIMSLAMFMQSVLGIMISGWLLSSAELGLFKSAQQTAIMIGFVLIVLNAVIPPRFASFYRQGDLDAIGKLARHGALIGLGIASPALLLCLIEPHWVLSSFGNEFVEAESLLRIVALAQLINVATGSVGFLLNMTGNEVLMRNIALACNSAGLLLFLVLIPMLEALGAALAFAFILIVQNLVTLFYVWRQLGIWTLPIPNVLRVLGVKPVLQELPLSKK